MEAGIDFNINLATQSGFRAIHEMENYHNDFENLFEGIAEETEGDLIPIKDEWFAMTLAKVIK